MMLYEKNLQIYFNFCHSTQKVTKKSRFTDASPHSNKTQEYKRKMGEKMRLTSLPNLSLIFSNFSFSQNFTCILYILLFTLSLDRRWTKPSHYVYCLGVLPSEFLRLKTSKQGKTKAEKLFERSEFFSAVVAICYVFSKNSVSNELFLWVAFLFCGKKEKYNIHYIN